MKLLASIVLVVCVSVVAGPLLAHHGTSNYADGATVTLNGVVTEFVFRNPHAFILFDVKNEKGEVVHWSGEMNSPGVLANTGWTRTTLKKGDQVTLTLRLSIGGNPVGLVNRSSVIVNGKRVEPAQAER
jgi:hypothetical protein